MFSWITQGLTSKTSVCPMCQKRFFRVLAPELLIRKKKQKPTLNSWFLITEVRKWRKTGNSGGRLLWGGTHRWWKDWNFRVYLLYTAQAGDIKWVRMSFIISCQWDEDAWLDHGVLKSLWILTRNVILNEKSLATSLHETVLLIPQRSTAATVVH